jgi:hypothetical protein
MIFSLGAVTQINLTNQVVGLLPIANGGTNTATAPANAVFMGPASGAAAAPSFRVPLPWEFGAVPDASVLRITFGFATGTGISDYGDAFVGSGTVTHVAGSSTLPTYTQTATSTTNGNVAGLSGNLNYVVGRSIRLATLTAQSGTTGQRMWRVLTDQTIATMGASDNPAGNYVGITYCNDGAAADCATDNTNWQFVTKDNVAQNIVDTNIAADSNFHLWWIIENPGSSFDLYHATLGNVPTLRVSSNAHLPTSTTSLRYIESTTCTTCTPTAQNGKRARTQIVTTY